MSQAGDQVNLLVILGPTASGKTRVGAGAARALNGEIISADSRQVFRGMDIGTGKDLEDLEGVPCHLIDILEPGEEFSVFDFQRRFREAFEAICGRFRLPILVGGTGLYLDAVLRGYQLRKVAENSSLRDELSSWDTARLRKRLCRSRPDPHNTTDLLDRDRLLRAIEIAEADEVHGTSASEMPALHPITFGLRCDRNRLRRRITVRLKARLAGGMIEEVERLHAAGVGWEKLEYYGLEYRFVAQYLQGELSYNDMFQKLNSAIHQFAKRQETWFRRMERNGVPIHWLEGEGEPLPDLLKRFSGN